MKVRLDTEAIKTISLFQNVTGSHIIDCINDEELYFVVAEGEYGAVIGKNGNKIKNAERIFRKQIVIFEYSPILERFIKNMIPETTNIVLKEGEIDVFVKPVDRARVIGKAGKKIKIINRLLKRLHDVDNLKVK
ncbi:MAG: NusA-like transcription termination signal-binding factor [Candidatus Aenigmarchaeota archaeon]|nr:NusA-like transcription termination signal-binding factor [Candidatus Aenigmarchaeota archaeon]